LKITAKWKPLPNRQNDVALMETLTETEEFSSKDLKDINHCNFTSPTYQPTTDKELKIERGREGAMEEGSCPGHGQFNIG
jgi:hypothetical protein